MSQLTDKGAANTPHPTVCTEFLQPSQEHITLSDHLSRERPISQPPTILTISSPDYFKKKEKLDHACILTPLDLYIYTRWQF